MQKMIDSFGKYVFVLVLFSFFLWGKNEYVAIILDGNKINDSRYANAYKDIPEKIITSRYKDIFTSRWGRVDVYDVQTGDIIGTLKGNKKRQKTSVRRFMIDVVNRYKRLLKDVNNTKISALDRTLDNIRFNSEHKRFSATEIYFLDGLLVSTDNLDFKQQKGFPNIHCLNKRYPFSFNKPFSKTSKGNIYVFNLKDDFAAPYTYYFDSIFSSLNLKLLEYRTVNSIMSANGKEIPILPISIDKSITLSTNENRCRLEDGTVALTDIIEDEIKIDEPTKGKVTLLGYNINRANTVIGIRFNGEEFTVNANDKGEYTKHFNLVSNDNILEVKMMDNRYKKVLVKSYKEGPNNVFDCKLSEDKRNIILQGRDENKKPGDRVRVSYMGHEDIYITVSSDGTFSKKIPVLDKENILSLIISEDSRLDCQPLTSNKSLADSNIDHKVENMTATICLDNEDRKIGDRIFYQYNGKEVTRKLQEIGGRGCFKMPLDYTKIHDFKIKQLDGTYRNEQIVTTLKKDFVRIRITFNSCMSDMDLFVLEPKKAASSDNRVVYFSSKKNYGKLDTDSHKASEGPENYSLDLIKAPPGKYYYWVNWYSREGDFKKYSNQTCRVRLDIIDKGHKSVKVLNFMKVPYTKNKNRQLQLSNYPDYGFKRVENSKLKLDYEAIRKHAYSFEVK